MTLIAVAPNKFCRGLPDKRAQIAYERLELADALRREYPSDAHCVGYVVDGFEGKQPRLKKDADVDANLTTIFVDIDNVNHCAWTSALIDAALHQYQTTPILSTCGIYHTAHGSRIVQPLATAVPICRAEYYIRQFLFDLDRAGLRVDWSCKDWTRHFRMPNVVRTGKPYRSPFMDLSRMRPVEIRLTLTPEPAPQSTKHHRTPSPAPAFTPTISTRWRDVAEKLSAAIRASVTQDYHATYLALAGALLARHVPPEFVPEIIRLAASLAGSVKPFHHERSARDTVTRHLGHQPVTGYRQLPEALQDALDDALATDSEARIRSAAKAEPSSEPEPVEATTLRVERAIQNAPDGLTVIVAECGLGKTKAAERVATTRARKLHVSSNVQNLRAPAQSKTAISVDKNALAMQIAASLTVPVKRFFGPLSVLRPDGTPECRYHDKAKPLVEGGQSLQWEFCLGRGKSKCAYYDECTAKTGMEGPSDARVIVGPHSLLSELHAAAGSTGLLVIDEPPQLVQTVILLGSEVDTTLGRISMFENDYATAMSPFLLAVKEWLSDASASTSTTTTFADLTAEIEKPPPDVRRPPIKRHFIHEAHASAAFAQELGTASKVLGTLYRAVTSESPVSVQRDTDRVIVTGINELMVTAVKREGAVVVMDANADLHIPALTKVVGYDPPVHRFLARYGAPIARTMLRCRSATRRGWLSHGRLVLDSGFLTALRELIAWANDPPENFNPITNTLGVITVKVVELALAVALDLPSSHEAWKKAGQLEKTKTEILRKVQPILRDYPGTIRLGHYGALRGLDHLKDADCLATLGDPWGNIGQCQVDAAFLGLDWEQRLEAQCRAELEQAHGRLRAVHRTRPGRALHIGNVLPGGSGWAGCIVRRLQGGRPPRAQAMPLSELASIVERLGGARETARRLGCTHTTINNYLAGRGVPPAVAVELRDLADNQTPKGAPDGTGAECPGNETPNRDLFLIRGFVSTCDSTVLQTRETIDSGPLAIGVSFPPATWVSGTPSPETQPQDSSQQIKHNKETP